MRQSERLTLCDARRWADWQTERTGERHVVYRRDPAQQAHGLDGLREVLPRFFVRSESYPAPERATLLVEGREGREE